MTRLAPPFRGQVTATAFVIDVGLVGEAEARRRVLAHWAQGATLRAFDARRWLLVLPEPVDVRSELAPGLPLGAEALAGGMVRFADAGTVVERRAGTLPLVDVGAWVRLDGFAHTALAAVQPPPPVPRPPELPGPPPVVDLRRRAAVKDRSAKAVEILDEIEGSHGPPKAPVRDLMTRMALRSPAGFEIRRRHRKYLEDLSERLRNGDYEALRDAIALGGRSSFLTLRMAPPRKALRPTPRPEVGGGGLPFGLTVHQHLNELYREVARDLERQGRIEEAAFVLADLMNNAHEAVTLLERHHRYALAAELAEGRGLDPAAVVRLWWKAGRRDRAVEVARARRAFAEAVRRLEQDDPVAGVALRAEWARTRAEAGDHVGAVDVAWPARDLRPDTMPWIQAGMALGGPDAGYLFAHLLVLNVTDEARAAAVALVSSRDPGVAAARDRFAEALARGRVADAPADREICTAALRAFVAGDPPPPWSDRTTRDVLTRLRERADPLLREDLPAFLGTSRRVTGSPAVAYLPAQPGELPVWDVVPLPGALLVAHGEHGTRLLADDGRVKAHWDTPAHALVVADHGSVAVVASAIGVNTWQLHRLDLVTRRLRPWFPLEVGWFVQGYDGDLFPVVGPDGVIYFLDAKADRARVLWRELDQEGQAIAVARSAESLAAIVRTRADAYGGSRLEKWRWDLPEIALRARSEVRFHDPTDRWVLTSTGHVGGVTHADPALVTWDSQVTEEVQEATYFPDLLSSGAAAGVVRPDEAGARIDVIGTAPGPVDATVWFPDPDVQKDLRAHGGLVALWDFQGRIAVVDPGQRRVVTTLRSRV